MQHTPGTEAITKERNRQRGLWTDDHDDAHRGELLEAALNYIMYTLNRFEYGRPVTPSPVGWPWEQEFFKTSNPIRDLEKAGALIAAEIDRLTRQKDREQEELCATLDQAITDWVVTPPDKRNVTIARFLESRGISVEIAD